MRHIPDLLHGIFFVNVDHCPTADFFSYGQARSDHIGQDDIHPLGYQDLSRHNSYRSTTKNHDQVSWIVGYMFNGMHRDAQVLQQGNFLHTKPIGYFADYPLRQDRILSVRTTSFTVNLSIFAHIGVPCATLVTTSAVYKDINRNPITRFKTRHAPSHFFDDRSHLMTHNCRQLKR